MERSISQEERIRRAEEIYFNRRGEKNRAREYVLDKNQKKNSSLMLKKMVLQILICIFLYGIIFLVKTTEYSFSEQVLGTVDVVLNTEHDWEKTVQVVQENFYKFNETIQQIGNGSQVLSEEKPQEETGQEEEKSEKEEGEIEVEENVEAPTGTEEVEAEENGVGGGEETSQDTNLSQMEIDAKYIKENYELVLPLIGSITSHFGTRTPTDIVSANHYGTDIGAVEGTAIQSIMEGCVTLVGTEGDYGKHIKIENGDISVLYAHCSELDVTEGQEVKIGETIAKVGSTGKATGPHLHIEIKRENRYIDPEMILPF